MAKTDKKALGKGIRALLGTAGTEASMTGDAVEQINKGINKVSLSTIEINPFQPRNEFEDEALRDLASSIVTFGLIQPITLRKLDGEKYQLISGERRVRASKLAGLSDIPAYVREANDQEMLEMALVENIQRADLNAIEVAISYQRLLQECNLTHEALSDRIGKNRSTVTNYVRLLKLPPAVQKALKLGRISMGHARALLSLETQDTMLVALEDILLGDLSVRATEKLVNDYGSKIDIPKRKKVSNLSAPYQQVVDHLSKLLGTKVQMKRATSGKGSLTIRFDSDDELNRILDNLEGN